MGTPAPSVRRNISCEARRAVRWAAPGHAVAIGARLLWVHGCRKEAAVKVAAGERSSGKHTRRRTVSSPNAVAATGVRGLLVRSFVTEYGAVGGGRARTWEAVGLNAKRACNDPSPPAFRA